MILKKLHKAIKILFLIFLLIILLSFIITEVLIISNAKESHSENADYLILLGAGLNKDKPSVTLIERIYAVLKYSEKNSTAIIIASGGKGSNEKYSEAEVISKYLQDKGISNNRIIIEDKSGSTYENLNYSGKLIDNLDTKIVIASSDFHLFRAKCIAKKLGYKNIGTLAGKTPLILLPNYYTREYFAIIKELLIGNI